MVGTSGAATIVAANRNTTFGRGAGAALTTGTDHVLIGYQAGNEIEDGVDNTIFGTTSCILDANRCVLVGNGAGDGCDEDNTVMGYRAGGYGGTGMSAQSCIFGNHAATSAVGSNDVFGADAGRSLTQGASNALFGRNAGKNITTGQSNILFGFNAGSGLTLADSNNIMLGFVGTAGTSGHIRVGTNGTHTRCFLQGVSGVTAVMGDPVFCTNSGQLGTVFSSIRFKRNIDEVVGPEVDKLSQLRVKRFKLNEDTRGDGTGYYSYGLIAEEVDEVFPELVSREDEPPHRPLSVQYHQIWPLVLRQMQLQQIRLDAMDIEIAAIKAFTAMP
jgi:hypothetical protein